MNTEKENNINSAEQPFYEKIKEITKRASEINISIQKENRDITNKVNKIINKKTDIIKNAIIMIVIFAFFIIGISYEKDEIFFEEIRSNLYKTLEISFDKIDKYVQDENLEQAKKTLVETETKITFFKNILKDYSSKAKYKKDSLYLKGMINEYEKEYIQLIDEYTKTQNIDLKIKSDKYKNWFKEKDRRRKIQKTDILNYQKEGVEDDTLIESPLDKYKKTKQILQEGGILSEESETIKEGKTRDKDKEKEETSNSEKDDRLID